MGHIQFGLQRRGRVEQKMAWSDGGIGFTGKRGNSFQSVSICLGDSLARGKERVKKQSSGGGWAGRCWGHSTSGLGVGPSI